MTQTHRIGIVSLRASTAVLVRAAFTTLVAVSAAHAQTATPEGEQPIAGAVQPKKENVRTGVIASSGNMTGSRSIAIDTDGAAPGDEANPIAGNVTYVGSKCVAKMTNSSKKNTYKVSAAMEGYAGSSKSLNSSKSATLKPGQSTDWEAGCSKGLSLQLVVKSVTKAG